jgi:hypothetical protein
VCHRPKHIASAPKRRPTPRFYVACAGGVTAVKTCISAAAKLRPTNSNSPKIHRRQGYFATKQIKPEIFTLLRSKSAELFLSCCDSVAAPGKNLGAIIKYLRSKKKRIYGQRPRHRDQVPAMHNEQRRGQRPRRQGKLPATRNEPRCSRRLGRLHQDLRHTTSGAGGNGLCTTIR